MQPSFSGLLVTCAYLPAPWQTAITEADKVTQNKQIAAMMSYPKQLFQRGSQDQVHSH